MILETNVFPVNSLVLVRDSGRADIPESVAGQVAAVTQTCIAVGTLEETQGETRIRVLDSVQAESNDLPALEVVDATLSTESGTLLVSSVLGERYLEWPTEAPEVRVRVYVNHSTEPDDIVVVVG